MKETKQECFGCKSYYIYYSRQAGEYLITDSISEAFDSGDHLRLEEEHVPKLITLLQYYKQLVDKNKANLSARQTFDYYHSDIEDLAKMAREINETAVFNKNLRLNH